MSLHEHILAHVEGNLQTRMLAGLCGQTGTLSAAEMLGCAKRNLRSCTVVGLAERFDETVLLLRKAYGWRMPFYVRSNIGKHRPHNKSVPADALRQIEAANQLDIVLYEYARELFEAQVRQHGPTLERDLRLFRAANCLWQRWHAAKRLPRQVLVALLKPILDPVYWSLARWGGLRRLLPSRFAPRVVESGGADHPSSHLWVGNRIVGRYDALQKRWIIQRPFHLLVDVTRLPGVKEPPW
jgi:hypothetical protein